jgi:pyridoxal phosphate enzyme (YggS family)
MDRKELINIRLDLISRTFHPDAIPCLVAVSKTRPVDDILHAYQAGIRDFGENRVEELESKASALHEMGIDDINWHFIGKLQSKKIGRLLNIEALKAIHSVDSLSLLQKLIDADKRGKAKCRDVDLFIQVNTSGETEKSGFVDWDDLASAVNLLASEKPPFTLRGLMTMSKMRTETFTDDALKCFNQLQRIRDKLVEDFAIEGLKLSMGMSNDYEIALNVGTDYIRLGSVLFAPQVSGE